MATAQLGESEWLYLIPRLPMTARGFLRHRRDLPFSARQVLERLGVKDLVLPEPDLPGALFPAAAERKARADEPHEAEAGIGALVRRIEAFQLARKQRSEMASADAPRLPLGGEPAEARDRPEVAAFQFTTDDTGRIDWADAAAAPLVVGTLLAATGKEGERSEDEGKQGSACHGRKERQLPAGASSCHAKKDGWEGVGVARSWPDGGAKLRAPAAARCSRGSRGRPPASLSRGAT
jgi:hypothetical protein